MELERTRRAASDTSGDTLRRCKLQKEGKSWRVRRSGLVCVAIARQDSGRRQVKPSGQIQSWRTHWPLGPVRRQSRRAGCWERSSAATRTRPKVRPTNRGKMPMGDGDVPTKYIRPAHWLHLIWVGRGVRVRKIRPKQFQFQFQFQ